METEGSDDRVSLFLKFGNCYFPLNLVIRMVIV